MSLKIHWPSEAEPTGGYAAVVGMSDTAQSGARGFTQSAIGALSVRRLVMTSAAIFLGLRVWILFMAVAFEPTATVDMLFDDAYYYLQIAHNVAHNGRSTYDGITDTNGYQPAWMALLVAVDWLLQLDKKGLFVATQFLLFAMLMLPLAFCVRRARDPFYLALAAGLTTSYAAYPGVFNTGLETVLFAPAVVAVAHAARHGLRASAHRVSWLFALVVMIRLDAVSLLIPYGLTLGFIWWREAGFAKATARLFRFVAPAAVTLVGYALVNWLAFGQPVPVSGMAKGLGAPLFANWGILFHYFFNSIPVVLGFLVLMAVELRWSKFEGGSFTYAGLGILLGALFIHYIFFAGFSGWIPWPWYFYAFALMVVLIAGRLVAIALQFSAQPSWTRPLPGQLAALSYVALCAVLLNVASHSALSAQVMENQRIGGVPTGSFNRRNIADAMSFDRAHGPITIAIGDRAGGLGYWSPDNVHVFALEGLVSPKAYLEARKQNQGEAWVREVIAPQYLVVDREQLELVRIGDVEKYVVIEPIQGRVVFDHFITYCFPQEAVVRRLQSRDNQVVVLDAPAVRTTFDMSKAEVCTGGFAEHIDRVVHSTESLRKTGVAVEYDPKFAGSLNAAMERFDRALALAAHDRKTGRDSATADRR